MSKLKAVTDETPRVKRARRTIEEREAMHAASIAKAKRHEAQTNIARLFEAAARLTRSGAHGEAGLQARAGVDLLALLNALPTPTSTPSGSPT